MEAKIKTEPLREQKEPTLDNLEMEPYVITNEQIPPRGLDAVMNFFLHTPWGRIYTFIIIILLSISVGFYLKYHVGIQHLFWPKCIELYANMPYSEISGKIHDKFKCSNQLVKGMKIKTDIITFYKGETGVGCFYDGTEPLGIALTKKNPGLSLFHMKIGQDVDEALENRTFSGIAIESGNSVTGEQYIALEDDSVNSGLIIIQKNNKIIALIYIPNMEKIKEMGEKGAI